MKTVSLLLALAVTASSVDAGTLYVSPNGNDKHHGSRTRPFKTIGKAMQRLSGGGTCVLLSGRYRTTAMVVGYNKKKPLKIEAARGHDVVFDGRDPISSPWKPHKGGIYKATVKGTVEQVFLNDQMLVEARWPNMKFPDELWDRSKWASAEKGSVAGKMIDAELAKTGIDWTGAQAVLNISHQWWTWTSYVTKHSKGQGQFTYDISKFNEFKPGGWWPYDDDRYYLRGKIEALDVPGEWFHDVKTGTLYIYPPVGKKLTASNVLVKRRHNGIIVKNSSNVHISGIRFVGCAFELDKADHCVVENCHLMYGSYSREAWPRYKYEFKRGQKIPAATIVGDHNTIKNCTVGYSSGSGLLVKGAHNLIEENLIHDICWNGSLDYAGIRINMYERLTDYKEGDDSKNVIRRCTVMNGGNALVHTSGPGHIVELCHVYNGGRACNDVSLLYTQLPTCAGTEFRYNWVHGVFAPKIGLGIRGDNKTRRLSIHHNVVWDCSWEGIIAKGDHNLVYNNTGFDNGKGLIMMKVDKETEREFDKHWPGLKQCNQNSKILNNVGGDMVGKRGSKIKPGAPGALFENNLETNNVKYLLRDVEKRDFRPKPDAGDLIDKGRSEKGLKIPLKGKAPDIGAYELGGPLWVPGITWDPKKVLGYVPIGWE